jgi:uncharacterized protein (TIGR03435 family)
MKFLARSTFVLALAAQIAAAQKPAFDAASVKKTESGGPPGDIARNMDKSPGHFAMRNVPMRFALEWAYDLQDYEIQGPSWIAGDERYDIVATAPGATNEQMRLMLRNLIDERFQMKSHWETRDTQCYVLTRSKGEPKLKPSEGEPSLGGQGGGDPLFHNQPVSRFTFLLTRRLARPVLDETGLKGTYDFSVDLSGLGFNGSEPQDLGGPSIFSAVQTDLGLKLEAAKRPIKILILDSANKTPTEN